MIVMSSNLYFVDTNNVSISGRLFVRLSDGDIIYFGDNVELLNKEVYPYSLYFKRKNDDKNKVYRQLEITQSGPIYLIFEHVIYTNADGQKTNASYRYTLASLRRNTLDQKKTDELYWGEYNALNEKPMVTPTFPTIATIITK